MQVDWISAFCEARAWSEHGQRIYDTGRVLLVGPGGEVERESSRGVQLEGSFENRILVQSRTGTDLYLSGNPVKLLQGHNLYGPVDPVALFFDAGRQVAHAVGLFPGVQTWEAGQFQGPRFTRIDLCRSYRFPSAAAARSWLRDVGASARSRHGGNTLNTEGTIYFGQKSTRWSLKAYHKADELKARGKGHRLPDTLPERERLFSWAIGVVRFEVTLRTKELEKLESIPRTPAAALAVWQTYYDKVTWNQNAQAAEVADMFESGLRGELRKTMAMWRAGLDLRGLLSHSTFYRHRRELLDQMGVDIAAPPPKVSAPTETAPAALDAKGWDPEPLEGYAWNPNPRNLV